MIQIVPDINFQGHFARMILFIQSSAWIDFWHELDVRVHTFRTLGIDRHSSDRVVLNFLNEREMFLITGNRNNDGPDSVESMIRELGASLLPVFTLGDANRILNSRDFLERVSISLIEYLIDFHGNPLSLYGAGRLYLPKVNS